jgi:phage terminase large subunit-like protein
MTRDEKLELLALLEEKERRRIAESIDCSQMSREEANEVYREVHATKNLAAQRKLCRTDLFYLLTFGLKRKDADHDWLYARCREVQHAADGFLDLWAREHYKAIDVNEVVPTPTGWKKHGDLKPGDEIFGGDGKPCRVIARTPVFEDAECFRVSFDDGYSVVVSGEHLWTVEHKSRRRIKGTANERHYRDSLTLKTSELFAHSHAPDKRYSIKQVGAEYSEVELPLHPYVLGAWIGDGHSADGRITCGDEQLFDHIKSMGYRLSVGSKAITRTVYGIRPILRDLGVLHNKHLPEMYLRASTQQRREMLRGLMDTDGHVERRGTATFVNKNKVVAEGVFELCASLGLKPTLRTHLYDHGPVYHVSFQAYKNERLLGLTRKLDRCRDGERKGRRFIVSVERVATVPVSCIQVNREDGLYLIGKNFVTTHNSTIITFAKTIQDILADPEITVGIFSHTRPNSKGFLEQIKREFENNEYLKELFPDVLYQNPKSEAPKWALDSGIIVKRKTNPKEATVEAWGLVDGQPTGKHFKILVYDDIVTLESVSTPDQIKKVTAALEMSYNLGAKGGQRRFIGTRYHLNDTYRTIMDRETVIPRVHKATDNGKSPPEGKPVFLSEEALLEKRRDMGPYTFGSQMLQDPVADKAMSFKAEWLRTYREINYSKWNIYIIVDPASAKKSTSDFTVMNVIGLAPDKNYYRIEGIRDRLNLTQRAAKLFELHRKYNPKRVGYERYGMQADIEHIKYEMEHRNYRFEIVELGGSMPKEDRIKQLIPVYEQGRMYAPERQTFVDYEGQTRDYVQLFNTEEYLAFPVCTHDDMLDCEARILDPMLGAEFPKEAPKPKPRSSYGGGASSWMG